MDTDAIRADATVDQRTAVPEVMHTAGQKPRLVVHTAELSAVADARTGAVTADHAAATEKIVETSPSPLASFDGLGRNFTQ